MTIVCLRQERSSSDPTKDNSTSARFRENGFEYEGELYKSLTAVAKAITGQHCSGFAFFKLGKAAT